MKNNKDEYREQCKHKEWATKKTEDKKSPKGPRTRATKDRASPEGPRTRATKDRESPEGPRMRATEGRRSRDIYFYLFYPPRRVS